MTEGKSAGREGRVDFRIKMAISVRFRVAKKEGDYYKLSPFLKGIGVDFSGGGASFKIARPIPVGYFIYLEMFFPFDKFPVSAVAQVIRVKDDELKGKKVFLCIVQYLLMSPTIQDKMIGYFINEGARQEAGRKTPEL